MKERNSCVARDSDDVRHARSTEKGAVKVPIACSFKLLSVALSVTHPSSNCFVLLSQTVSGEVQGLSNEFCDKE